MTRPCGCLSSSGTCGTCWPPSPGGLAARGCPHAVHGPACPDPSACPPPDVQSVHAGPVDPDHGPDAKPVHAVDPRAEWDRIRARQRAHTEAARRGELDAPPVVADPLSAPRTAADPSRGPDTPGKAPRARAVAEHVADLVTAAWSVGQDPLPFARGAFRPDPPRLDLAEHVDQLAERVREAGTWTRNVYVRLGELGPAVPVLPELRAFVDLADGPDQEPQDGPRDTGTPGSTPEAPQEADGPRIGPLRVDVDDWTPPGTFVLRTPAAAHAFTVDPEPQEADPYRDVIADQVAQLRASILAQDPSTWIRARMPWEAAGPPAIRADVHPVHASSSPDVDQDQDGPPCTVPGGCPPWPEPCRPDCTRAHPVHASTGQDVDPAPEAPPVPWIRAQLAAASARAAALPPWARPTVTRPTGPRSGACSRPDGRHCHACRDLDLCACPCHRGAAPMVTEHHAPGCPGPHPLGTLCHGTRRPEHVPGCRAVHYPGTPCTPSGRFAGSLDPLSGPRSPQEAPPGPVTPEAGPQDDTGQDAPQRAGIQTGSLHPCPMASGAPCSLVPGTPGCCQDAPQDGPQGPCCRAAEIRGTSCAEIRERGQDGPQKARRARLDDAAPVGVFRGPQEAPAWLRDVRVPIPADAIPQKAPDQDDAHPVHAETCRRRPWADAWAPEDGDRAGLAGRGPVCDCQDAPRLRWMTRDGRIWQAPAGTPWPDLNGTPPAPWHPEDVDQDDEEAGPTVHRPDCRAAHYPGTACRETPREAPQGAPAAAPLIRIGPGRLYLAHIGTRPPHEAPEPCPMAPYADPGPQDAATGNPWHEVGPLAPGSALFEDLNGTAGAPIEPLPALTGRTFTASFQAALDPRIVRLLFGARPSDLQAQRSRARSRAALRALRRRAAHIRRTTTDRRNPL